MSSEPRGPGITYPVWAVPHVDGVELHLRNERVTSMADTRPMNESVRAQLSGLPDFDGWFCLAAGGGEKLADEALYSDVNERVPEFRFWVYDWRTNAAMPFRERLEFMKRTANGKTCGTTVRYVDGREIPDAAALRSYEQAVLKAGHRGLIVRGLEDVYGTPYLNP